MAAVKSFYSLTNKELYNITPALTGDKYALKLYFYDDARHYYEECLKRLSGAFSLIDNGSVVHYRVFAFQISITDLERGEGSIEHGFTSYTFNNNYIRLYWNNNKKEIIFHKEL